MSHYEQKYLKYKKKFFDLKGGLPNIKVGNNVFKYGPHPIYGEFIPNFIGVAIKIKVASREELIVTVYNPIDGITIDINITDNNINNSSLIPDQKVGVNIYKFNERDISELPNFEEKFNIIQINDFKDMISKQIHKSVTQRSAAAAEVEGVRERRDIIKIYMMRHGDRSDDVLLAKYNCVDVDKVEDPPLANEGLIRAAHIVTDHLSDSNIKLIISSPLLRCVQTAGIAKKALQKNSAEVIPFKLECELREVWDSRLLNKEATSVGLRNKSELHTFTPHVRLNDNDYLHNLNPIPGNQEIAISALRFREETKGIGSTSDTRFKDILPKIASYAQQKGVDSILIVCHGDMLGSAVDMATDQLKMLIESDYCGIIGFEFNTANNKLTRLPKEYPGIGII
jgi:broad specificity phosphatase PhoE